MGLQNWTILKPGMFPPFESQTSPVFGCQQYYVHPIRLNSCVIKDHAQASCFALICFAHENSQLLGH